jgi:hypothetical protein
MQSGSLGMAQNGLHKKKNPMIFEQIAGASHKIRKEYRFASQAEA